GAGRDRRPHHRARECKGAAQERARQVLRRRRHAQAQASGKTKGREEAHEASGFGRNSTGGIPRGAAAERQLSFALFLLILLVVNGTQVPLRQIDDYLSKERMQFSRRYLETLNDVEHEILLEEDAPAFVAPSRAFPYAGNCNYNMSGLACTVPPGHYFAMGD